MKIERSVIVNQPKAVVFDYLRYMKNGSAWSPWDKKDVNMVKSFRGVDGMVGAVSSWSGNKEVGVGEQEITAIVPGERIDFELRFEKPMKTTSVAYLVTEAAGERQTRVTWGMVGHSSFPGNIICLIMNVKQKVGNDFQAGLDSLKLILDKN